MDRALNIPEYHNSDWYLQYYAAQVMLFLYDLRETTLGKLSFAEAHALWFLVAWKCRVYARTADECYCGEKRLNE
jgi:hypothetical protein